MDSKNYLTTVRLDTVTKKALKGLVSEFGSNNSEVIRQSIRLMKELKELKKQYGEIRLNVGNKEILLLVG